jgi:deoxyribodipyrimidine photo-lyase
MKTQYAKIKWEENNDLFEKWKEGKTGCPIVDAAMRHLKATGYMPNRLRMVVANYLVKDLLIDWRRGERYFATQLVDSDPAQNNGGWQWAAGCGTDSQPYFRIFNPCLQSEKHDSDCKYILKWVPELKNVDHSDIHFWETKYKAYRAKKIDYPDPIVVHTVQKEKCLNMFKEALYGEGEANGYDGEVESSIEHVPKKSKKSIVDEDDEEIYIKKVKKSPIEKDLKQTTLKLEKLAVNPKKK